MEQMNALILFHYKVDPYSLDIDTYGRYWSWLVWTLNTLNKGILNGQN